MPKLLKFAVPLVLVAWACCGIGAALVDDETGALLADDYPFARRRLAVPAAPTGTMSLWRARSVRTAT